MNPMQSRFLFAFSTMTTIAYIPMTQSDNDRIKQRHNRTLRQSDIKTLQKSALKQRLRNFDAPCTAQPPVSRS